MKKEFFFTNFRSLIVNTLALIAVYSHVVIYILAPMIAIYYGIVSIVFIIFPLSWMFADPRVLLTGIDINWLNMYISGVDNGILFVVEIFIFVSGLLLFLISLIQLTIGLVKEQDIFTKGIYKHIRHPQNLAIIIMALPIALYVPGFQDLGIRLADLINFVQFTLIVIIYSDWEERRLMRKYPEIYLHYYESTGSFLPKLLSREIFDRFSLSPFQNPRKRYLLFIAIYCIIVNSIYLVYISGIIDLAGYF